MVDRKWMTLTNTSLGILMASIDGTSITIALPTIGRELANTSALDIIWMVIGYQLVTGSVLVNIGRFADLFGRARLYKLGYLSLTVGSLFCSISQTGDQLVFFRFIQGGGAALIQANTTAIIMDAFPPKERGRAIGINTVSFSGGLILGLVVGGALTTLLGWRSIFWINVPVGVFSLIWSHYTLKELAKIPGKPNIDLPGNITFLTALTSCLVALTLFSLGLIDDITFTALLVVSIAAFAIFLFTENRVKIPMLSLKLFKIRTFAVGNAVQFINGIGQGTGQLVLTFYLQGPTMGLTPLVASFFFLPSALSNVISGPLSGALADKYGARPLMLIGSSIGCVGFFMLSQLGATATYWQFALPLVIQGVGGGLFMIPNRTQVVGAVNPADRGVATGVYMTFMNVGGVLSRGVTFLIMGLVVPATVLQAVFGGQYAQAGNPALWEDQFIVSVHYVFYAGTAIAALATLICLLWLLGVFNDKGQVQEEVVGRVRSPTETAGPTAVPGESTPANPDGNGLGNLPEDKTRPVGAD